MDMNGSYEPPLALTILSAIFLILGAICFLIVAFDILWRQGWKSMMWIMIPVYPINAAYMLPIELYVYFRYGRPTKPSAKQDASPDGSGKACHMSESKEVDLGSNTTDPGAVGHPQSTTSHCHNHTSATKGNVAQPNAGELPPSSNGTDDSNAEKGQPACHQKAASRPMWATLLVGVSHCGAGCVLGDIVGEWLVYGTGVTINGQSIWPELLIDYAFALLFGIIFQYFSIAPMSGEYGPKTVWRAVKADILSLTSFEVGAFGWMIIYQVAIFDYRLSILSWTYWWMMQIGMALGFATAIPMNWFLITYGIKEPCC